MPLFSIITPVYNNEKYVKSAVESILQQGIDDYEYILIDDGSTDNTPQILDEMAGKDKKIRVIHQENQWIYASFNNGIKAAAGKYIYILNSDDRMRQGALRRMTEIVEEYEPDVIWTKVLSHRCDEEQRITEYDYGQSDQKVKKDVFLSSADEVRNAWFTLTLQGLNHNQANLYKRELMLKHPFRNDVYGADTLFNIAIADDINTAFVMKEAVYDFMVYSSPHMNASEGKYYPYLHEMFNDIYTGSKLLYKAWNLYEGDIKEYWSKRRMGELTDELYTLCHPDCKLTTENKVAEALRIYEDMVIRECALESDRQEELESRILSGLRMILAQRPLEGTSKYFFIYELLEGLLCYEKSVLDYEKVKQSVYHPLNRNTLGKAFFLKLKKEDCWDS
ncbi:MAG: glycosyltransferase [Lachnospiraceae bacterium]|nr:glycosyltransferase [Lachnospiraceae bacterium]